jgi:hypothetical protein
MQHENYWSETVCHLSGLPAYQDGLTKSLSSKLTRLPPPIAVLP